MFNYHISQQNIGTSARLENERTLKKRSAKLCNGEMTAEARAERRSKKAA